MLRKALVLLTMICGTAGLYAVVAPPASAAIDHPFAYYLADGVTLSGTVYVDTANGKASAHITWNTAATNVPGYYTIVTTLYRDNRATTKNCGQIFIPANSNGRSPDCNSFVPNPAGQNKWQASITVLVGLSPNQTVKGPYLSDVVYA